MFRTIRIKNASKIQYIQGYIVIYDGEEERKVFLEEVSVVLIESTRTIITIPFLVQCIKNNVLVIVCDETHNPTGTFLGLNKNYKSSGNLFLQIAWDKSRASELWKHIVQLKIFMQKRVLEIFRKEKQELLDFYMKSVEPGDPTNREGLAAKVYFSALFGNGFSRGEETAINNYLDYGYSIILSCFNREIVAYGYLTQLGIFHIGQTNPFNLSSDFMEPFRPVVDLIIFLNLKDNEMLKHLRKVFSKRIWYNGDRRYLDDAIRNYTIDCIRYLNNETNTIPGIDFLELSEYEG